MPPRKELSDLIQLERVRIVEELDDAYKVKYGNDEYNIAKDSQSHWNNGMATHSNGLELRQELRLVPEHGIFQDEQAPAEFKEVMMFHEIREREYSEAGFDDAHERAMNDEVLYILKFFEQEKQKAYLTFAAKYRRGEQNSMRSLEQELLRLANEGPFLNQQQYAPEDYEIACSIRNVGERWDRETFTKYQKRLEQKLSVFLPKYPNLAFVIGKGWPDEFFHAFEEMIVKAVALSSESSEQAGWNWEDKRFTPYAEIFAKSVARDLWSSVQAGWIWKDERFMPYAELFVQTIKGSPPNLNTARYFWPEKRKKLLK